MFGALFLLVQSFSVLFQETKRRFPVGWGKRKEEERRGRFIEWDRKDLRTKVHELNGTFEMNKDSCICECSSKPFCVVRTERSAMSNPKRIHREKNAKKLPRAKKPRQTSIFRHAFFFAGDVYSRWRQPRRPPSPGRGGDRGPEPLPAAAGGRQAAVKLQSSPTKDGKKLLKVVSPPCVKGRKGRRG